jgi:L-threonylcarbamoyladenylate synthase
VKTETVAAIYYRRRRSQTAATERAVELLRAGEIVALPTETVYGLAADALNPVAVAKIFEAKERPRFDPLIVHLPDRDWLKRVAKIDNQSGEVIEKLIAQFWPGPLTLVLGRQSIVPEIVTAGLDTVAVRISEHPIFAEIILAFGAPIAAPSANRFGRVSPTTAQHVLDELGGRIPLIVDAGPTKHGIESTIVSPHDDKIDILRRGPITAEQLSVFGKIEIVTLRENISAPGQLPSHYAPKTPVQLVNEAQSFLPRPGQRCGLLAWNLPPRKGDFPVASAVENSRSLKFVAIRQLSDSQDLREAAANLFRFLRELDALEVDLIVAERVPDQGLGAAIMDRLRRASNRIDTRGTPG